MLLQIEHLEKTYRVGEVEVHALRDISLDIAEGEFTAIAGPSGSGKTTLLNCIGLLDKGESGKILFNNEDIMNREKKEQAWLRRENFGFIFQTYNLIPVLTVAENIEMPLKLLKDYNKEEAAARVSEVLRSVGLEGYEDRKPLEISGGQQQRVSIARALVKKPRLILADEPTANLDSKTGEDIVKLMQELNEKDGTTFIFSTHDRMVMDRATRLITIRDGQVVEDLKKKSKKPAVKKATPARRKKV